MDQINCTLDHTTKIISHIFVLFIFLEKDEGVPRHVSATPNGQSDIVWNSWKLQFTLKVSSHMQRNYSTGVPVCERSSLYR
jgi:hypothetical protein